MMIKNIRLTAWGIIVTMFTAACTDDTFSDPAGGCTEGYAKIPLSITIPDVQIVQTRGEENVDPESSLENLDVLLFDTSGGSADENQIKLVAHRAFAHPAEVTNVDLPLSDGHSRSVYVMANAGDYLNSVSTTDEDLKKADGSYKYSLGDIRALLETKFTGSVDTDGMVSDIGNIPHAPLPMAYGPQEFSAGLTADAEINALMVRAVAKISVSTPLGIDNFAIKSLTLCNGARTVGILSATDSGVTNGERMGYTLADSVLYAYPTAVEGDGEKPVSVVVEANYNKQTSPSFYRLLITKDRTNEKSGIPLLRNHHYLITINRVQEDGEASLQEAIAVRPANISYQTTVNNDFSNTVIVGGSMFSLDYERVIVYADSLQTTQMAEFRTNYPLKAGVNEGSITVDEGLALQGKPYFTAGDSQRNLLVSISPAYDHGEQSDSAPKGIHITLGGYKKTIEVVRRHSLDVHPERVDFTGITNAKFISSSGDLDTRWVRFSLKSVFLESEMTNMLTTEMLGGNGGTGYLHLDENMNVGHREANIETISTTGFKTRYIMRQEGIERYLLGFFGGTLQTVGGVYQYSQQLIIEGYEENAENLTVFTAGNYPDNLAQKQALHAFYLDGRQSTIVLARDYQSPAALYCLNKNRDTNGNGKIDDDEVRWYLPGIKQGMGILMYQVLAQNLGERYWSSSCVYNEYLESATTAGKWTTIQGVWGLNTFKSNNGYAVLLSSYANAANEKCSVRCVRDY